MQNSTEILWDPEDNAGWPYNNAGQPIWSWAEEVICCCSYMTWSLLFVWKSDRKEEEFWPTNKSTNPLELHTTLWHHLVCVGMEYVGFLW
jgi:hypothetical protein